MTMDELNAFYNKMSVYGDTYGEGNFTLPYKDPFPKSIPIDPNAGQPPILEPLMPPMKYINQGGDNNGGIKALAGMDYGYDSVFDNTNITPIMPNGEEQPQTNFEYDIGEGTIPQEDIDDNKIRFLEGLLSLPGQAIGSYMKYGPIGQVKRGIEFVKEKQKVAAENQRLEALAQIEQARKQKESQAIIDAALKKQMQDTGVTGDNYNQAANIRGGGGGNTATNSQGQTAREATYDGNKNTGTSQGYSQHYAKGGRIRYGKGGIVTL